MRAHEHRDIGRGGHAARRGTLVQQQPVFPPQPHREPGRGSERACALTTAGPRRRLSSPVTPNRSIHDAPQPHCLRQEFSLRDLRDTRLQLRRDPRLQNFSSRHGSQCDPIAAARLSCLSGEMCH
jgi:hypothetical protein